MTRRTLSGLLVATASVAALLPSGASARVNLHIPSATVTGGTKHVQRFSGYVSFEPPTGWTRRNVGGSGEQLVTAKFSRTLTPGCLVTAYVGSTASVNPLGPIRQLKSALPTLAELGAIVPPQVSTLAQGQVTRGDGGYIMGAPFRGPDTFTLVGGALAKVASAHWAGLTVGVAQGPGCPTLLPYRSSVATTFSRLLRGMTLKSAAVGKLV